MVFIQYKSNRSIGAVVSLFATGYIIIALLCSGCVQPSPPLNAPAGDSSASFFGLPSNAQLTVQLDRNAPAENPAWVQYMQDTANYRIIRSLTANNYADLQFLKTTLSGKRIIQLGESSHGVREFNMGKVRLIKFLHEEMGVNVIAFETPMFACYAATAGITNTELINVMRRGIFGVWHTEEVLELFRYVRQTQSSANPLRLVGFDSQVGRFSLNLQRPALFREALHSRLHDQDYAEDFAREDSSFVVLMNSVTAATLAEVRKNILANKDVLLQRYERVLKVLPGIASPQMSNPTPAEQIQILAALEARNTISRIRQIVFEDDTDEGYVAAFEERDKVNAENVYTLAHVLYPKEKVALWAHNVHIRYNNQKTEFVEEPDPFRPRSMGYWLAEMFRDDIYTIGLYMYRGTAAYNNRQVYTLTGVSTGSLESIAHRALKQTTFIDLRAHKTRTNGNAWMFDRIKAKDWGNDELYMILREQYDGILFFDTVSPPQYVQ